MAKRALVTLIVLLLLGCRHGDKQAFPPSSPVTPASASEEPSPLPKSSDSSTATNPNQTVPTQPSEPGPNIVVGATYRQRYSLSDASVKLIDNRGEGDERLYGLRNVRAVLSGVYYRGGANNYYNKHKHRANMNPLPNEGLQHLCEEGFGRAVYLYHLRYQTAPHSVRCRTFDGAENTLEYDQISPLDFNTGDLGRLHEMIYDHIRNPRLGPIYLHCWNGWHASGFVAATALIQFCGFSADQAVDYWNRNTDGYNGRSFNGVRAKIRSFIPKIGMDLSPEERKVLCPHAADLRFQ